MNNITLIGIVPQRTTYHCTEDGRDLLRFTVQTKSDSPESESQSSLARKRPGASSSTDHHCQVWGPAAIDLHKNLGPGDQIMVRGELKYKNHKNRRGELTRYAEIHVRGYTYLGKGDSVTKQPRQYPHVDLSVPLVSE